MLQLNDTGAQTPNSGVSGKNRARYFFCFRRAPGTSGNEREHAVTSEDKRARAHTAPTQTYRIENSIVQALFWGISFLKIHLAHSAPALDRRAADERRLCSGSTCWNA